MTNIEENLLEKSFPSVACFSTLHHIHIEDRKKAILEMIRVAKNNVVISELTPYGAKYFDEFLYVEENHQNILVRQQEILDIVQGWGKISIQNQKLTYFINIEKFDISQPHHDNYKKSQ